MGCAAEKGGAQAESWYVELGVTWTWRTWEARRRRVACAGGFTGCGECGSRGANASCSQGAGAEAEAAGAPSSTPGDGRTSLLPFLKTGGPNGLTRMMVVRKGMGMPMDLDAP
jgi:hypothetical protein